MNNKTAISVLSAMLIAAVVSGCVQKISDYGIVADQTSVEVRDPFGI